MQNFCRLNYKLLDTRVAIRIAHLLYYARIGDQTSSFSQLDKILLSLKENVMQNVRTSCRSERQLAWYTYQANDQLTLSCLRAIASIRDISPLRSRGNETCFSSLDLFTTISTVIPNQSHYTRLSLLLSLSLSLVRQQICNDLQRAMRRDSKIVYEKMHFVRRGLVTRLSYISLLCLKIS